MYNNWLKKTEKFNVDDKIMDFIILFQWQAKKIKRRQREDEMYISCKSSNDLYEGWNFNSGNYLFTTDTK